MNAGVVYRVNEREEEYSRPSSSGEVIPLSRMRGGTASTAGNITLHVSIDARGSTVDSVRVMQAQIPGIIRQAANLAKAEISKEQRQGKRR